MGYEILKNFLPVAVGEAGGGGREINQKQGEDL